MVMNLEVRFQAVQRAQQVKEYHGMGVNFEGIYQEKQINERSIYIIADSTV